MWYVSERQIHVHFIYLTKYCQHIGIQIVPTGTVIGEAYMVKIYQVNTSCRNVFMGWHKFTIFDCCTSEKKFTMALNFHINCL